MSLLIRVGLLSVILVNVGCAANAAEPVTKHRLNLLLITADDMNADSAGWMGNAFNATPNLDAFAGTAHRFVNAHVTAPICQPGRSALMTGLLPHRSGALGFHPVKKGTPTLVSILKDAGYFTAVIDKHPHMKPDAEFPWDMTLSGGGKNPPMMRQFVKTSIQAASEAKRPFFLNANITDPHRPFPGGAPKANPAKPRKGKPAANADDGADDEDDAPSATKPSGQPARIYKPDEITVPSFLEDVPALRAELAQYYTGVGRLDVTFKQIMDVLRDTGHEDDTIVVFWSDHGISMPFAKATVYRNGTWSPIVIRWPGMGEAQVRKEYVSSLDLMPTLLELLAVEGPKVQDGRSLLPLVRGESQPGRDHVITHVNSVSSGKALPQRCIRTANASLMFMSWPDGKEKFRVEAMGGQAFRAMLDASREDEKIAARVKQLLVGERLAFYDLTRDPDERVNRIDDPAFAAEIDRLAAILLDHMKKSADPETEGFEKALASRSKQD